MRLEEKREQAETALNEALECDAGGDCGFSRGAGGRGSEGTAKKEADAMTTVSPGQEFLVAVDFHNGSKDRLFIDGLKLEVPEGWGTISDKTKREVIKPGDNEHVVFRLRVPKDAAYTRPYWHRDDPETESVNHIDDEKYVTLPFPPPVLRARVEYSVAGAERHRGEEWHWGDRGGAVCGRGWQGKRASGRRGAGIFGCSGAGDAGDLDAQRVELDRDGGRDQQS